MPSPPMQLNLKLITFVSIIFLIGSINSYAGKQDSHKDAKQVINENQYFNKYLKDSTSKFRYLTDQEFHENYFSAPMEPYTVATIVLSVAKLFAGFFSSSNGPSVIDFIKNTNTQLALINEKFDIVLNDLDEIKQQIDKTPSKVVATLRQNELKGRINEYIGIMTGLRGNAYRGNIAAYMNDKTNYEHVKLLANHLREVRAQLEALEYDPFTVPFVTMAMNMEYYLRLNFLSEKAKTVAGSMAVDRDWLIKCLFANDNSLQKIINQLSAERYAAINNLVQNYIGQYSYSANYVSGTRHYGFELRLAATKDVNIIEDTGVIVLRKIGILKDFDIPIKLSIVGDRELFNGGNWVQIQPQFLATQANLAQVVSKFKSDELEKQNTWLLNNYFSLISIASSYYAGLKSLEFCNIYLRVAGIKKS